MSQEKIKEMLIVSQDSEGVNSNAKRERFIQALTEEYFKVEGWPEEQKCNCAEIKYIHRVCGNHRFNEALRLCKLAAMKEKSKYCSCGYRVKHFLSREQIEECLNSVFSEYALNGQANRHLTKSLADALLELINGQKPERG